MCIGTAAVQYEFAVGHDAILVNNGTYAPGTLLIVFTTSHSPSAGLFVFCFVFLYGGMSEENVE